MWDWDGLSGRKCMQFSRSPGLNCFHQRFSCHTLNGTSWLSLLAKGIKLLTVHFCAPHIFYTIEAAFYEPFDLSLFSCYLYYSVCQHPNFSEEESPSTFSTITTCFIEVFVKFLITHWKEQRRIDKSACPSHIFECHPLNFQTLSKGREKSVTKNELICFIRPSIPRVDPKYYFA